MIVLKKGYYNQDKNKSVQEIRQAEDADFYYIDPLNKEDEEDDGIFFGKCSDNQSMQNLRWLFNKALQPYFILN